MSSAAVLNTLSIDIGTTTVVAARTTGTGADLSTNIVVRMPAVVGVDADEILTGDAAAALSITHPDQTVAQLIRRLGDSSPVILDGRAFNIGELLGRIVSDVAGHADVTPADTTLVLTHPAGWKDHRLALLQSIGAGRGFAAVEVVSDPIAITQNLPATPTESEGSGHFLVVDVGGGTVDATIVATATATAAAAIVVTQSLERLGGNDFDQAVFGHVMASVDNMMVDLDRRDPVVRESLMTLRSNCTGAKERLSTDNDATVDVAVPGLNTAVRITRAEFEAVIRPQVDAIVTLVDRVIASAGAPTLDRIITTGGSATIPLVGETLSGHLGQAVAAASDPAAAAALGAATPPQAFSSPSDTQSNAPSGAITSPERGMPMSNDKPPTDTTTDTATGESPVADASGAGATGTSSTRHTPPAPPKREEKSTSTGGKVAVGVAATAAAAAAAVVFGDDIAAALEGDDATAATTTPPADAATDDDSMDEFDTVAPADDVAGPAGVPLDSAATSTRRASDGDDADGPGGPAAFSSQAASRPTARPDRPRADRDNDGDNDAGGGGGPVGRPLQQPSQPQARPQPQREATEPAAARVHDAPDAPDAPFAARAGAPAAAAAAPAAAAAAATQAAPAAMPAAPSDPAAAGIADARFEAARQTLLERLENFEAPAGTSPEDAAVLQQELADAVARFQPQPGQSTEAALAAIRDDYDQRVQDFVQDQKIDALVEEMERDNQAEAAEAAAAAVPSAALEDDVDDSSATAEAEPTTGTPPLEEPATIAPPADADADGRGHGLSDDGSRAGFRSADVDPGIPAAPFDAGDVTSRNPDLPDVRPDIDLADVTLQIDRSAAADLIVSPGLDSGRAGVVGAEESAVPAAAAAEPLGSRGKEFGRDVGATGSSESAATAAGPAMAGRGLEDDFDAAASRFEVAPSLLQQQSSVQFALADSIDVGVVGSSAIHTGAPETFKLADGLEPVNLGRARAGGDDDDEDGNFTIGRAGGDGAGGDDDDDFGLTIGRAGGDDDDDDGLTIARAGGDDDDEDGLTIARAGGDDDDDGDFTIEDVQTIEPLTPVGLAPVATAQIDQAVLPTIDLGDDLIGDSVYAGVVETALPAIETPLPEGILIGLDQPSPEGILIGLDQPGASSIDAAGLQVRAELPPDFVPPVYIEPEPFMVDVPIVEEAVSDFGVQGLEDEGNLPVVDDIADDLIDG